jgi:hypothetical protein
MSSRPRWVGLPTLSGGAVLTLGCTGTSAPTSLLRVATGRRWPAEAATGRRSSGSVGWPGDFGPGAVARWRLTI